MWLECVSKVKKQQNMQARATQPPNEEKREIWKQAYQIA